VLEPASAEINDEPLQPADVAEIVVARQQVGSPLEGTLLQEGEHEAAFVNALADAESEQAAEPEAEAEPAAKATSEPSQPTQYNVTTADGTTTLIASDVRPETEALVETLALAIKQLYAHADWHEQGFSWERADEVRKLARGLARERALVESVRPLPATPAGGAPYSAPICDSELAVEPTSAEPE
jgi:hypothetical protein